MDTAIELFGTHKVTFGLLRTAAIQCYALDVAASQLFLGGTHQEGVGKTKSAFEELFTIQLLNLAIGLRTKFYQGLNHFEDMPSVLHSGLLYKYKNCEEANVTFSIKDVCDKIIHADSVSRVLEPEIEFPITKFRGIDPRSGSTWELEISVSLFVEGVLNWIHAVETKSNKISGHGA